MGGVLGEHCISATAKRGLEVACIQSCLLKTVQIGEVHLILVQLGATWPTHGYREKTQALHYCLLNVK